MDHKGVFARKPVADIIATEGSAFKSLRKVLGPFSRLGIWIAIGLVIYFAYGRFRSRLRAK